MGDGILHDQCLDSFRMCECHSKADGSTVVLHVEGVAREYERLGEMIHNVGIMVERVRELLRVRPVAVSETRVIRRYEVIAVR